MGLKDRFLIEKEEMADLLSKVMNYHEIIKDLKEKAKPAINVIPKDVKKEE